MRAIVFILLMLLVFVSESKKKKKKQAPGQGARAGRPAAAPPPAPAAPATERASAIPVMHRDDVDEEGCVGGSMAHDSHEGESLAEHKRHVAAMQRREVEETETTRTAEALGEMNLRRLRQAVVMAEVLGKPRALRRGR